MTDKMCANCLAFDANAASEVRYEGDGICRLYPQGVQKSPTSWCLQFCWKTPSEEVLSIEVAHFPKLSQEGRRKLLNTRVHTLADVLALGKAGMPDLRTLREVEASLEHLGVNW
jgi:hypothetical protein